MKRGKIAIIAPENTREKPLFSLSGKFGSGNTIGIAS